MFFAPKYALPFLLLLTAACGGGGGDGTRNFNNYAREGRSLLTEIEQLDPTTSAQAPVTGSVGYDGVFALIFNPDTVSEFRVLGDMDFDANFSDNSIAATLSSAVDDEQRRYDGALQINGNITRAGITAFDGDLTGQIDRSGAAPLVATSVRVDGNFWGDNADIISGFVDGSFSQSGDNLQVDGSILGKR